MLRVIKSQRQGKMVYLAPMRALCSEKLALWKERLEEISKKCVEYSDDCDEHALIEADLVICTPEKLEFNSRDQGWLAEITLVMLDEVHFLNDERGATLEAIICRLRIVNSICRFVAVSATIPNVGAIALWLRDRTTRKAAKILRFPDSMRPVPLKTQVFGYDKGIKKAYEFEFSLNYRLPALITKHSEGKQTLIFCSTRSSTEKTAEILSQKMVPKQQHLQFENEKLTRFVNSSGVGFHHAGLSTNDRNKVEDLFRANVISVLCATSTLAVGVNLPARLVIIKSTLKYAESGYQEYNDLEVRQMIGRAGRAGYDAFGTALILTDKRTQSLYNTISEGRLEVKSKLTPDALIDYLNIEIAAMRVKNISEASEWFSCSFISAQNMMTNNEIESKKSLSQAIEELKNAGLVSVNRDELIPTQMGSAVSSHYLSVKNFSFLDMRLNEGLADDISEFLQLICSCPEMITKHAMKRGDKEHLHKISTEPGIRYPLQTTQLNENWKKSFLLLQVALQSELGFVEDRLSLQLKVDMNSICDSVARLLKFTGEYFLRKGMALAFRTSLELLAAVSGRSWPDDCKLLQQVDGIGRVYARKLFASGIQTIKDLAACEDSRIEVICGRNPPFGHQTLNILTNQFPQLNLSADLQDDKVVCNVSLAGVDTTVHFFLIGTFVTEGPKLLHHEISKRKTQYSRSVKIDSSQLVELGCHLMSSSFAGTNVHLTFKNNSMESQIIESKVPKENIADLPDSRKISVPKIIPQPASYPPPLTTPQKRPVPSPVSSEKSAKTKLFLGTRHQTLSKAQSFLQKYAPVSTQPVRSSLLLPARSVQQSLSDEIELELRSLD